MQGIKNRYVSVILNYARRYRSARKKIFWSIPLLLVLLCCGYWLKCQFGINFFESVSISSHFPFSYFNNRVIETAGPGIVLYEDFDHARFFNQWYNSALRHNRNVVRQLIAGGSNDHSACLQISAAGTGRWAYPFLRIANVKKGDVFYFEGLVYLKRGSATAALRVASMDMDRNVIDYDLAVRRVKKPGRWIKVQKRFTIEDSRIRYISFRLTGNGGNYRFDNLLLSKLN